MDKKKLEQFRESVSLHRDSLLQFVNSDRENKKYLLGGRTVKDVLLAISELKDVLEKIDGDTFGKCAVCDGEVELDRLEIDCTTSVCLDHYSPHQIRELERDLELAGRLQKQLLPCCVPSLEGIQIAFHSEPFHIVGGDYYDFFGNRNGAQGFVIADVMGKGLPASMLMSNLQASLRILGPEHDDLPALVNKLNELFRYNVNLIKFISVFLASIDPHTKVLDYCNAGHHPPLLWKSRSRSVEWLNPTGPAIGLIDNPKYSSKQIALDSGDLLLLYTDGLYEVHDGNNKEFGEEGIAHFIRENYKKNVTDIIADLLQAAKRFAGQFNDDVTIIALKLD